MPRPGSSCAGSAARSCPPKRSVPARGRIRVLVDFSRHPGRSVYHCHILDHEEAGMMAVVDNRGPGPS